MYALTFYSLVDGSLGHAAHARPEAPNDQWSHSKFFFHQFSCFSRETQPAPNDLCSPPDCSCHRNNGVLLSYLLPYFSEYAAPTYFFAGLSLRVPELSLPYSPPGTHQIRCEIIIPSNPLFLSTALPFLRLHFPPLPKKDRIFGVAPSVLRLFLYLR